MVTEDEIIDLIKEFTGCRHVDFNSDIYKDLRVSGDDFHDLIDLIAATYQINMSSYLWYFHANEEGSNIGGLFFKPPNARVSRIPITPRILTEIANKQNWDLQYPDHKLPRRRLDLIINKCLFGGFVIFLVLHLINKYIRYE